MATPTSSHAGAVGPLNAKLWKTPPPSGGTIEMDSHVRDDGEASGSSLADCCLRLQDLADDLSSELSGNFRSVVLGLLMLPPVYDAYELRNAIKVRISSRRRIL